MIHCLMLSERILTENLQTGAQAASPNFRESAFGGLGHARFAARIWTKSCKYVAVNFQEVSASYDRSIVLWVIPGMTMRNEKDANKPELNNLNTSPEHNQSVWHVSTNLPKKRNVSVPISWRIYVCTYLYLQLLFKTRRTESQQNAEFSTITTTTT